MDAKFAIIHFPDKFGAVSLPYGDWGRNFMESDVDESRVAHRIG